MERVWIIGRYWKVPRYSVISEVISDPWPSSPGLVWSHHPLAKINIPQNKGWLGWLGTILMPTQV